MKKIGFFLVIMSIICSFTACSDDDGDTPQCPVTGVVLPKADQKAGTEFQLVGTGFSANCEIWLKATESFRADITERLSSALTVMIPATLAPGNYSVVLKQDGEWDLGKLTVIEGEPVCPVTNIVVPDTKFKPGDIVIVKGKGFDRDAAELYLKQGDDSTKMTLTVTAEQVSFTLPADVEPGAEYSLVLKQDGVWPLTGNIKIKDRKLVRIENVYVDDEALPETKNFRYDKQGRLSVVASYEGTTPNDSVVYKWSEGKLTLEVNHYRPAYGDELASWKQSTVEYTLENGQVKKLKDARYEYNSEEYLATTTETLEPAGSTVTTYTHSAGQLKEWKQVMEDDPTDDYPPYVTVYSFDYTTPGVNKGGTDLMGEILLNFSVEEEELFYARIAGLFGKAPEFLPSSVSMDTDDDNGGMIGSEEQGTIAYQTDETGYISEIKYSRDGSVSSTLTLSYDYFD